MVFDVSRVQLAWFCNGTMSRYCALDGCVSSGIGSIRMA